MLQTEYAFMLPCGYVDAQGAVHRAGVMRRATALDEIEPLVDPQVRHNEAYLGVVLLERTVTSLGTLVSPGRTVIERLFAPDYQYLQELYVRVNGGAVSLIETACPRCGTPIVLDPAEGGDAE